MVALLKTAIYILLNLNKPRFRILFMFRIELGIIKSRKRFFNNRFYVFFFSAECLTVNDVGIVFFKKLKNATYFAHTVLGV